MHPLEVLHSLHFSAQAAVQATEQQLGMAAQTQVSQEQLPHPLPETALQPLWTTGAVSHLPALQILPVGQMIQALPEVPHSLAAVPE